MVTRTFQQLNDGQLLTVYLNVKNLIYLKIERDGGDDPYEIQSTLLSMDDAIELRNELDNLIKEMNGPAN